MRRKGTSRLVAVDRLGRRVFIQFEWWMSLGVDVY